MKIADNCVVSFHYTLTNEKGDKVDSSIGKDPLSYLHGAGNIVPGLEKALEGRSMGENLEIAILPAEGYGDHNPEFIQKVPRSGFPGVEDIQVGMQFQAQGPDGQTQVVTVKEVSETEVTVDGNHPLAGHELSFDVSIENVRSASEEEIEHGHAH